MLWEIFRNDKTVTNCTARMAFQVSESGRNLEPSQRPFVRRRRCKSFLLRHRREWGSLWCQSEPFSLWDDLFRVDAIDLGAAGSLWGVGEEMRGSRARIRHLALWHRKVTCIRLPTILLFAMVLHRLALDKNQYIWSCTISINLLFEIFKVIFYVHYMA